MSVFYVIKENTHATIIRITILGFCWLFLTVYILKRTTKTNIRPKIGIFETVRCLQKLPLVIWAVREWSYIPRIIKIWSNITLDLNKITSHFIFTKYKLIDTRYPRQERYFTIIAFLYILSVPHDNEQCMWVYSLKARYGLTHK